MAAISSTPRPAYIYDTTLAAWVPIGGPQGVEGGTTTLTTKGDILTRTSSAIARQAVGTDNFILISDSSATNGISWTGTPKITTINDITGAAGTPTLWSDVTTGSIAIGAGLTTGALNIATVGTGITPIAIGHTNATIGLTGNTTVTGTLTSTAAFQATTGVFTGATLAINGGSPQITSSSTSVASIFTSNVNSILIGSSTIKSTLYPANGTTTSAAFGAGYMGMPQVSTATTRGFVVTDAGKHIYVTATGQTLTIPANTGVAFPIGTTIVVVNASGVSTSIAITTDTLRLANSASTGTRTLASNGMCTLLKINSTEWIASGNGLT
jgi:hypothetical protein